MDTRLRVTVGVAFVALVLSISCYLVMMREYNKYRDVNGPVYTVTCTVIGYDTRYDNSGPIVAVEQCGRHLNKYTLSEDIRYEEETIASWMNVSALGAQHLYYYWPRIPTLLYTYQEYMERVNSTSYRTFFLWSVGGVFSTVILLAASTYGLALQRRTKQGAVVKAWEMSYIAY